MQKTIKRREVNQKALHQLEAIHPVLKQIYASRDIFSSAQLERELSALLPFAALKGVEEAVTCLVAALKSNASILIIGDFDADGATSTVVAIRALRLFGAKKVDYLVPNRFAFGYGLTKELVEVVKNNLPDVIVTVDNGIANHAGVAYAKSLGVKVIITDHHLAAATLPEADAIVNPNQPGCVFESKNLAGVGVIFYVMLALRRRLSEMDWFKENKIAPPNMATLLDLVALGTVADLVALDRNNRILVHHGLLRIRGGRAAPGIAALLEMADRDLTRTVASDLGFAVGARLNAAGRLDDMSLGIECLLTDDSIKAREIARKLDALNHERRAIEQDMQQHANVILDKLSHNMQGKLPNGLCLYDESWHQGVIGILASRIKDKFHRPVIIMANGQAGELKGSGRSIPGFHMRDALSVIDVRYPSLIKKFGGHAMAAGLSIHDNQLNEFIRVFDEIVTEFITEDQLKQVLLSDGALHPSYLNLETAQLLREAGPWGQAFPEPIFDDEFKLLEQRIVGDKHLKLKLEKNGQVLEAIYFFVDTEKWPNHRSTHVHAAYRLDVNEYKGRITIQLMIDHLIALS